MNSAKLKMISLALDERKGKKLKEYEIINRGIDSNK